MRRRFICLIVGLGFALAMMSERSALEFSGGLLATLDDVNRVLAISDASGQLVEQKTLRDAQYQQLMDSWTKESVQSVGFQTALIAGSSPVFGLVQANDNGRSLYVPYGAMTSLSGSSYQVTSPVAPLASLSSPISSPQQIITSANMILNGVIESTGKVFAQSKEIRLTDGFNAKKGSEVRLVPR